MAMMDYVKTIYYSFEDPTMYVQEFKKKTKITLALPDNMGLQDVHYDVDRGHLLVYTTKENAFGNAAENNYKGCIGLKNYHVLNKIRSKHEEEKNWYVIEIPKDPYYTLEEKS